MSCHYDKKLNVDQKFSELLDIFIEGLKEKYGPTAAPLTIKFKSETYDNIVLDSTRYTSSDIADFRVYGVKIRPGKSLEGENKK